MPTPRSWTPTEETNISNSIFGSLQWTELWVRDTLTFSFGKFSSSYSTDPDTGYGPTSDPDEPAEPFVSGYAVLNSTQQAAVRLALGEWTHVANLKFAEVSDDHDTVGDLRFAFTAGSQMDDPDLEDASAWAYLPAETATGGDVWFNAENAPGHDNLWKLGSFSYMTALHEIGHAIGLKHPFESVDGNEQTLPSGLDSRSFTIMSYSADPGRVGGFSFEPTTPMVLDIMAIQQMYGKNMTYHATDTVYTFLGTGNYHKTIWDAGGTDTYVYDSAGNTTAMKIDLRTGYEYGSHIGKTIKVFNADGVHIDDLDYNVWNAFGTIIEKATGGDASADTIFGNGVNNVLIGRGGADKLFGGLGNDSLIGGNGFDRLSGGEGADLFKLANSSFDTIVDFGDTDVIQLDNAEFTRLSATGALKAYNFRANATGTAVDADDFIIYETDTGKLFYDANGNAAGGKVQIGLIGEDSHFSLHSTDFQIV